MPVPRLPEPATLVEMLAWRASVDPEQPFVLAVGSDGGEGPVLGYAEAGRRAALLAAALAERGVGPGDVVGCYLPNTPAWVVASFAVWRRAAAVGAVGTLLSAVEARVLFELARAEVVVTVSGAPPIEGPFARVVLDDLGSVERMLPAGPAAAAPLDVPAPDPGSPACVFFTSGTTGRPKGVPHTHAELVAGARRVAAAYARRQGFRPRSAPEGRSPGIVFNPFGHAAGYGRLAFRLWIGRPTVLVPKFTVAATRALLERFALDSLQLTPAMIHMLATTDEPLSLEGVNYVTSGTAPLSPSTRDLFEERFGVPVLQAYGMTEVGSIALESLDDVRAGRRGPGSVGRVTPGTELRIVDDAGAEAAAGEDGEIWVRTSRMPAVYVGGQSAPLDAEGWFHTGDVGHLDADGILRLTARTAEKLVVGGLNVYPAEVEEALRRSPLVLDAVVVGLPDERLGERPVAGVVWAGAPDPDALVTELRQRLAHYKVPRAVFPLEAVPLTPRDKVDRPAASAIARRVLGPAGALDQHR